MDIHCKKCGGRILNTAQAFCDNSGVYHEGCILTPEYYAARYAEGEALARMILEGRNPCAHAEELHLESARESELTQ